ncbi:MAG: putative lipoic acid-binding regulatory protein [Alphaproteobacteria bacterium]|jgi:putative lipoic acid-binding regulatory protein
METHFDELLEFPCMQNFKVMGVADEQLPIQVITRLQALAPGDYAPTIRPSSKGNYHALSLAIKVTSKEHMETIYTELAKLELVRVVL